MTEKQTLPPHNEAQRAGLGHSKNKRKPARRVDTGAKPPVKEEDVFGGNERTGKERVRTDAAKP